MTLSSSSGSFVSSLSDSIWLIIGIIAAAVVLLAIGSWWMCCQRTRKRFNGPRNSHSQSTEYMDGVLTPEYRDCVLTPGLMAIVADGTGRKWFSQLSRMSSVPSMELLEQLGTEGTRVSGSAATTTATALSPMTYDWLVQNGDWSDELACNTLALEQCRLPPQSVVNGELLHEGSFTLTFRATLKIEGQTNRQVVVRRLLLELADQETYCQAFMADISLSASLLHPRIVAFVGFYDPTRHVYDLDSPSSPAYMTNQAQPSAVTEFMPNGDLRALLTLRPRNAYNFGWFHSVSMPKTKAQLALDIVDALVYLHSRPTGVNLTLHHQRLKAQRVLLSEQCDAKLCAFGVRRALDVQATFARNDFSVAWLAPEILRGESTSEQADVYALGVLFTELDTCTLPFAAGVDMDDDMDEQRQLALLVSSGCIRPALSMDCPMQIQELVMRCLSFSPQQRPPAVEVQHTLRNLINGTSICDSSLASLSSNVSSLRSTSELSTTILSTIFTP